MFWNGYRDGKRSFAYFPDDDVWAEQHPKCEGFDRMISQIKGLFAHRRLAVILLLSGASLVSLLILGWRVVYTGKPFYLFLVKNLLLAWIPLLVALWAHHLHRGGRGRTALLILPGMLWLLFFPNAPYIVSDLVHLRNYTEDSLALMYWFDMIMIASFAWTGLLLGFVSMYLMQAIVRERSRPLYGWLFAAAAFLAGGFGIYLGRVQRWHSIDLINEPTVLLQDIMGTILNPLHNIAAWNITFLFAVMMLTIYGVLYGIVTFAGEHRFNDDPLPDIGRRALEGK